MWVRIREALQQWLLQGYEPVVKAPPVAAPVVMSMEDAGNENVQKAPATAGPVHMSMKGVGSGNVQLGNAEGDVTIQVNHQTPPNPVTTMTSTHVHHHYYGAVAPVVEPYRQPLAANSAPNPMPAPPLPIPLAKIATNQEQRYLLDLMELLNRDTRIRVLDFMRQEFKTGMVRELNPNGVYRTRKYVEKVLSNLERQRA